MFGVFNIIETAMCCRVVGSAPFLKGDLIEHFQYGTRFKQKQVTTTHLHAVGKERAGFMYSSVHCSKHLPNDNYLLLEENPWCIFPTFFKGTDAECFPLQLQHES